MIKFIKTDKLKNQYFVLSAVWINNMSRITISLNLEISWENDINRTEVQVSKNLSFAQKEVEKWDGYTFLCNIFIKM